MSYEIPTLIGSLVDRAIAWENCLDGKRERSRTVFNRLVREANEAVGAIVYSEASAFSKETWQSQPVGQLGNYIGLAQGLVGAFPSLSALGIGSMQAQDQQIRTSERWSSAEERLFARFRENLKKLPPDLSTNRYL